jgi:hypothetical protein
MILDAGFRAAIDSDLLIPDASNIGLEQEASNVRPDDKSSKDGGNDSPIVRSPTFEGFSSSPPSQASIRSSPAVSATKSSDPEASHEKVDTELSHSVPLVNSTLSDIFTPLAKLRRGNPPSSLLSDDGLQYITNGDNSGVAREGGDSSACPPSCQPQPAEPSQIDSLFSTIPPTVDENNSPGGRPASHASSTVTNPFYDIDRENEAILSDPSPVAQLFAPKNSRRTMGASKPSPATTEKHRALPSHRQGSTSPLLNASYDTRVELPTVVGPENGSIFDPTPSTSQVPDGSYVVDLTFSSDHMSPDDDEDFSESQGLPRGPGWVQKRNGGPRVQTRSSTARANAEEDDTTRPRRGTRRLRKSVV